MRSSSSTLALAISGLASLANALPTIETKGAKLFTSDGNQFFMKGVAYQLTNDDPLAAASQCETDVALMKTIGTNAIRVYHVDPTADHDACMSALSAAGIYAWIDLDTFSTYIVGDSPTWTTSQYQAYGAVMDAFAGYDNVAGFFVGNEVLNQPAHAPAAPYVKAAIADMKAYRDSKNYRNFPIGYSAADIAQLRPNLQNYLACGDSDEQRADFFALNSYEWCGDANFDTSGYSNLQSMASSYNIPIWFSETGCNVPMNSPRSFADQSAILGPDMNENWSGAIIYEWVQEGNDYGLISYPASAVTGEPTPIQPAWDNLSAQWATLSPTGVAEANYQPSFSPPVCPPYTAGAWEVSGDIPLPTLGAVSLPSTHSTSHTVASTSAPAVTSTTSHAVSSTTSSGTSSVESSVVSSAESSAVVSSAVPSSAATSVAATSTSVAITSTKKTITANSSTSSGSSTGGDSSSSPSSASAGSTTGTSSTSGDAVSDSSSTSSGTSSQTSESSSQSSGATAVSESATPSPTTGAANSDMKTLSYSLSGLGAVIACIAFM